MHDNVGATVSVFNADIQSLLLLSLLYNLKEALYNLL